MLIQFILPTRFCSTTLKLKGFTYFLESLKKMYENPSETLELNVD